MLVLPESGMVRSIGVHNVDRQALYDWIEASAVFECEQISQSDVVDSLTENGVYESQEFASEIVDEAWKVLTSRFEYLGEPLGLKVAGKRITRDLEWSHFPAYGFCLAISCAALYPSWARTFGEPYSVQGEIFEELTVASLERFLNGWKVRRVGWSPENTVKLKSIVSGLVTELNEVAGAEMDVYVDSSANELGLDVLAYRPFDDGVASFPVFMLQCASGKNWKAKRHTPDLNLWKSVVNFTSRPVKGFAMPYAFESQAEFRKQALLVDGLFLDRTRLLRPLEARPDTVPRELGEKMKNWVDARLVTLPNDSA